MRRVLSILIASFASSALLPLHSAEAQPSWFPTVPCRQAWQGRDLAQYDFARDAHVVSGQGNLGYAAYQSRIQSAGVDRRRCFKDWTVLVYMAADNDLSPYALWDLHEMEGAFASGRFAGSTLKTDLLVQADTRGLSGVRRIHVFQRPGTTYTAPRGRAEFDGASPADVMSPIVHLENETRATTASEHKRKLREFLDWGMREYPAEHYFVIVWGHGQGWAADPVGPPARSRFIDAGAVPISFDEIAPSASSPSEPSPFPGRFGGLAFSETPGDYLGVPSLSAALQETVTHTLEGRPIDVYAADACLMQMAEVAYEISPSARFVLGSAQVQSFLGLPYRQLMYQINTSRFGGASAHVGRDDEAFLIARMLPQLAAGSLDPIRGQQGRADRDAAKAFTMSSISTAELRHTLVPALRGLGTAIRNYVSEDPMRSMDLEFVAKSTPNFMGGARELGSFIGLLNLQLSEERAAKGMTSPAALALQAATDLVREAVGRTVISYSFGSGYRTVATPLHLLGFRALGIWIPQSARDLQTRRDDFEKSAFFRDLGPAWTGWMDAAMNPASIPRP